jgi:hypothetical protein
MDRYLIRYDKLLKMPQWTNKELSELHGSLLQHVIYALGEKESILKRLNNLDKQINL